VKVATIVALRGGVVGIEVSSEVIMGVDEVVDWVAVTRVGALVQEVNIKTSMKDNDKKGFTEIPRRI
jgi:hypothetical protein